MVNKIGDRSTRRSSLCWFIRVDARMRTNIKGILAAGDITGLENQLVVACAKGTLAALTAAKYLRENEPWTFKPVN